MSITFRPGTSTDVDAFLPLIRDFYVIDQHDYDESFVRPALELLLGEARYGRAWFIEADGTVVGYIVLTYGFALESGGRDALIDEFYIDDAHRGRGIGRQAVDFLRQHCRDEGIQLLYLEVENHNQDAFAFYERVGFTADDSTFMSMEVS